MTRNTSNTRRLIPVRPFLVLMVSAFALCCSANLAAAGPTDIPLKRVVLYFAGLAYFEHAGTVTGDAVLNLSFKTGRMNDVLKTLVVRDLGGGSIQAVNYPTQEPVDRTLQTYAVDLSGSPSLATILSKMIGQELVVKTPELIKGRLISLEERQKTVGAGQNAVVVSETWLNVLVDQSIRSLSLNQASSVEVTDPKLQSELTSALDLLKTASADDRRSIDIVCHGTGTREIRFSYVQEAPLWKTSYRLDLSGAKPYLQAWALVENASETDWKATQLTLAGGQPIAFIQDLYSALYAQRPVVQPPRGVLVAPQTYEQGNNDKKESQAQRPLAKASNPASAPALAMERSLAGAAEPSYNDELLREEGSPMLSGSGVQAVAASVKEGQTFTFAIKEPVTLSRRQSAMIPIVSGDIEGQAVSIYNSTVHQRRPLLGVWLSGLPGLRLPAGPVAVFDGSIYAGDSLLDTLGDKEKRLLSYGVDLDVLVDTSQTNDRLSVGLSLVKGVLITKTSWRYSTTYTLKSSAAKARTLLIEHPFNPARTLSDGLKFVEKTPQSYRFLVNLEPAAQTDFVVREQQTSSEETSLLNLKSASFSTWTNGEISAPLKAALAKAASLKLDAERFGDHIAEVQKQQTEIGKDQERLRANLQTVGTDSVQGKRYLQKLSDEETQLDKLVVELETTQKARNNAQKTFEDYLRSLTVE